jgi:hypothetical protein
MSDSLLREVYEKIEGVCSTKVYTHIPYNVKDLSIGMDLDTPYTCIHSYICPSVFRYTIPVRWITMVSPLR